jgi:hypothetical protein
MKTEHKLYAAIVALVVLAVAVYLVQKGEKKEAQGHVATAASADLPKLAFSKDDVAKITKLEIKNKDKGDVTLEKVASAPKKDEPKKDEPKDAKKDEPKKDEGAKEGGEDSPFDDEGEGGEKDQGPGDVWKVSKPLEAPANSANVKSMLDNLEKLGIQELITKSADGYAKYELDGDKTVHVVAYKGSEKVLDMYFGKSGSRGQMARIAGVEGVYVVKGYSSYLFARELKNWRNTDIWKFEDKNVIGVQIENESGKLSFSKNDDKWSGSFTKRDKDGKVEAKAAKWDKFDESKLKSMLSSYKTLRAADFAEKDADTGLDAPVKNGGLLRILFKDNAPERKLEVGKKQKNDDRFARDPGGDGTVYVLSSWTAKWAVAKPSEFEKPDEKKGDKKDDKKGPAFPPPSEEEDLGVE